MKLTLLLKKVAANDFQLRKVELYRKRIGDVGAKRLAYALRDNTVVTVLGLGCNSISDEGARALADMLKVNSSITNLDLQSNSIGEVGARALAKALEVNSSITKLHLGWNSIGDDGAMEMVEMLEVNSSITMLILRTRWSNDGISNKLVQRVEELIKINNDAPNPKDARRLKIVWKVGWLLDSEVDAEAAAVELVLDQLGIFPKADQRRGLFEKLLGSPERGADVATARTLYLYATDCGAAPGAVLNLMRAHPSLCVCRDVRHHLFPFMLLATMTEAGVGDVLELLLLNPNLVESGIGGPV